MAKKESAAPWDRGWTWLIAPMLFVYFLFFLAPEIIFGRQAFYESAGRAQVDYSRFTWSNLTSLITDDHYRHVLMTTFRFGLTVVAVCIILGFPLAYVIARSRVGRVLLVIVLVVSFTGMVVRALGWQVILGGNGVINKLLMTSGVIETPLPLINNMTGAIIGTVHAVLPYMILLITPVIEAIHPSIEEAAAGLGASWRRSFRSVVLPLSLPGIAGGSVLVLATTVGSFTTPALLGGPQLPVLAVAIRQQTSSTLDYPLAAAMAIALTLFTLMLVYLTNAFTRRLVRM